MRNRKMCNSICPDSAGRNARLCFQTGIPPQDMVLGGQMRNWNKEGIGKMDGTRADLRARVGIVMGSDSDMPVMAKAADVLEELGVGYEMAVISAHREPEVFYEYARGAEEKGYKVIIAGAGMAAHLPGMCAAIFPMPVIGIPMHTSSLGGRDSLYSIVQMPSGIPVATVAINGGANAGLLAARILAVSDQALLQRLKAYSAGLKEQVEAKNARLQEVGYKAYLENGAR